MVTVTRELAERIAAMAELLLSEDDSSDATLRQLADLSLELIPGSAAAGVVIAGDDTWADSASAASIAQLHRQQLDSGAGPVAESLRFGEARRIDDAVSEDRWPQVCAAMTEAGLRSCLILPLRTDREPGGVLAVYGRERGSFAGAGHDIALLFAAQGGVAMRNALMYRNCRRLVENLRVALESRAVIEQAKGILVAEYGYGPEVAFKRLSVLSQNTNRKVKDIAADLVAGRIQRGQFGAES
ncbi:MAG TPA: GAF and ANTAR domain-containing protein [Streptosporangiaceae bacterium]|nr:GAF and ANTAR domain-containing protein [Streptosporangiaceae bacterium]